MWMRASMVALCLVVTQAQAVGSSQSGGTSPYTVEQIAAFGKRVEKSLAQRRAFVALIARKGRSNDELPPGFEYTHLGIAMYSTIRLQDGREVPGYAIHSLYQRPDDLTRSYLTTDFPVDFFNGVAELKAGILIPTVELQQRLQQVMQSDIPRQLHVTRYSSIANPYNTKFQNCTEHTLDIINAAIYNTTDMKVLKANARAHFKAQEVRVNPFKLILGTMFVPDIATSDQDEHIMTATYETIARYLLDNQMVQEQITIAP